MPKQKKQTAQPPRKRRGTAQAVEVIVGDQRRHIGLVAIEHDGKDERGHLIEPNGIRWAIS